MKQLGTFGERLKWVVDLTTGRQAADSLELSHGAINSSIRNGSASFKTLRLLHEITGVDLNWLVCGEGGPGKVAWPETDTVAIQRRTRRRTSGAEHRTVPPKKHA